MNTNAKSTVRHECNRYVCPACKGELEQEEESLCCPACQVKYPILAGIPGFILDDLRRSEVQVLRYSRAVDWLARIYETGLWYTPVLRIYGGRGAPTFPELTRILLSVMSDFRGLVLDAACGPSTWGRRIALQSKEIDAVDMSWGMLRRGMNYAAQAQISNMYFAQSKVETLPFANARFDAAICGGALHLFPDTVGALREIARTMKAGAPLAVMTFIAGEEGILRSPRIQEHLRKGHGVHVFGLPELEGYLNAAGFADFKPQAFGSVLVFRARKH